MRQNEIRISSITGAIGGKVEVEVRDILLNRVGGEMCEVRLANVMVPPTARWHVVVRMR